MEVILLEKVANLGDLGNIKEVNDGYARNYLIPYGKAKRATKENLAEFEQRRAEYERLQDAILADAKELHARIHGNTYMISAKAGVDGKLFGSVSAADIAAAINQAGNNADTKAKIKKSVVLLPNGTLKTTGEFDIDLLLHHDIRASIKISVVAEEA